MSRSLLDMYRDQIESHRQWLHLYDEQLLKSWENLLSSARESAICEACLRLTLQTQADCVKPGEDPARGGPDFECIKSDVKFYVECSCILQDTAENKTCLPKDFAPSGKSCGYSLLTDFFKQKSSKKGRQLGRYSDTIRLFAIGTLHFHAGSVVFDDRAAEYLLAGECKYAFKPRDVNSSFCIKRDECDRILPTRQYLSAVLLCYFHPDPEHSRMYGALHPDPACPFDHSLLPEIPFCRFKDGVYDCVQPKIEWVGPPIHGHR